MLRQIRPLDARLPLTPWQRSHSSPQQDVFDKSRSASGLENSLEVRLRKEKQLDGRDAERSWALRKRKAEGKGNSELIIILT